MPTACKCLCSDGGEQTPLRYFGWYNRTWIVAEAIPYVNLIVASRITNINKYFTRRLPRHMCFIVVWRKKWWNVRVRPVAMSIRHCFRFFCSALNPFPQCFTKKTIAHLLWGKKVPFNHMVNIFRRRQVEELSKAGDVKGIRKCASWWARRRAHNNNSHRFCAIGSTR